MKRRYLLNKEKVLAERRVYRASNKEAIRAYARQYKRDKLRSDPDFKLANTLRKRLHNALRDGIKVGSAVQDLGCTISELRQHLEARFQPGMSWQNHGEWHIDHIRPLASFDLSDRAQLLQACHYTNLQPLWAVDNLKKGTQPQSCSAGVS